MFKHEANIMGNYHEVDTPPYDNILSMRNLEIEGFRNGFSPSLIERLEKEVHRKSVNFSMEMAKEVKLWLDEPTFQFFQAYNKHIVGTEKRDLVLLVNGYFTDNYKHPFELQKKVSTTLPFMLGENPYQLFKSTTHPSVPLDTAITDYMTSDYLSRKKPEILKHHHKYFVIESSSFYFIPRNLSDYFYSAKGEIDFEKLVPFLDGRANHVGMNPVGVPSLETYMENCFNFSSKRFKLSPVKKIMRKLNKNPFVDKEGKTRKEPKILSAKDMVCDWSALRVVRQNMSELDVLQKELLDYTHINLGKNRFNISGVLLKDYFSKPKEESGFKAYVNHVFFENKGQGYPIEIQFQTNENYYGYELLNSPTDPASRLNKERRRVITEDANHKAFNDAVRQKLTKIYGQPQTIIDISRGRVIN